MENLNLPVYEFRIRQEDGADYIFDAYRRKYVLLTPEEKVRQAFARFLVEDRGYPAGLILTEQMLRLHGMVKRADILVHKPAGTPMVLVECKAPGVPIRQAVFEQAARYNISLQVPYLMLTNGMKHFCFRVDRPEGKVVPLEEIPFYESLRSS
ncbi:MAG: type I restriction enzyme HsdR N-terminal domain-containing protein [Bacteroidales bacterium]